MNTALVIYIAGVPASGKSTLIAKFIEELADPPKPFHVGKLRGIQYGRIHILGVYDGSPHGGTDKLSQTVIDDAIKYCRDLPLENVVVAEGSRLFNGRFLSETQAIPIVIDAHPTILNIRHKFRGDRQSEAFLKGCRSRVENMIRQYGIKRFWNNTDQEQEIIISILKKIIKNYGKQILRLTPVE